MKTLLARIAKKDPEVGPDRRRRCDPAARLQQPASDVARHRRRENHCGVRRDHGASQEGRVMPRPKYSYDDECERLARHFITAPEFIFTEEHIKDLAQEIQTAVEDYIATAFELSGCESRFPHDDGEGA